MNLNKDTAEVRVRFPFLPQANYSRGNDESGMHAALKLISIEGHKSAFFVSDYES